MISTRTMASVIGPLMAIMGVAVALRADAMTLIVPAFLQDAPLVLITGAFTLLLGLIMIAAHQRWDSAAGIVISVLGWITAIRGAILVLASDFVGTIAPQLLHTPMLLQIAAAIVTLIGVWLTFVGWFAKPSLPKAPT